MIGYLNNIYRAGAYIRLSKEDENGEAESASVINQRNYIKEFAEKNGFEIYDYYIDDGYSGGNFDRPNFKRLIEDIENKKINTVITKDISRLGRDFIETGHYMFKYFPEHNVRYIAITENFDTYKPNGVEDIIPFQAVINDIYLKDTSRKIKSIRHNKMEQGLFVGSTVSYGYKRAEEDNRKFEIDEYSANVVKKIFNLREQGKNYAMIARELTNDGIEPPSVYNGKKIKKTYTTNIWKASSIKTILTNEIYIGNLVQRKFERVSYKSKKKKMIPKEDWIIVENNHPAIISKEQFSKVNDMEYKPNSSIGMTRTKKYDYLLKGLVVCADCGKMMYVRKSYRKNKKKPVIDEAHYCCKTNVTYRNSVCSLHYFREPELNEKVIKELREVLRKYANKTELEKSYDKKLQELNNNIEFEKELESHKNKLNVIAKAVSDLYKDRASDIITSEDFYKIKEGLDEEKQKVRKKIEDIEVMLGKIKKSSQDNAQKEKAIQEFLKLKKPNKIIMQKLIKRIEIDELKNVKIYFNFNLKEVSFQK